ncbi:DinB family protein [Nocardioides rubriscoriae]|uniref:DinB family protein n=1 Tax=Nocardioides rubriscoriae TaxID=642762 RepID=UPI0011DF1546|nr:DinB family protein [Nocardioides rubriscoriae]
MTSTPAQPVHRDNPPYASDEVTTLRAYLDYHRDTLRWKTSGLTQQQMAQTLPSSTLHLAGLLKHLALVEDWWFGVNLAGVPAVAPFDEVDGEVDPEWEFRTAADDTPEQLHALYDSVVATCDAHLDAAAAAGGADTLAVRRHPRTGEGVSLRWVLLHMIEEYARHNGHADLIREAVDGQVGE